MQRREIVTRAIEFGKPPRLPFWQDIVADAPNDFCDCWEMDRAKRGWFFDRAEEDDWGCRWAVTDVKNMGQVVHCPLEDWANLDTYRPPDPRDPFYFERIDEVISRAGDRYVVIACHFNLIERLHMLHGFAETLADFHLEPARIEKLLDMILEFKLEMFAELHRRMVEAVHGCGWHFILHSCGKVNDFVPYFIDLGIDVLNLQQPRAYGIEELGRQFAGKVCFLTTADIQVTIPKGDPAEIREEVRQLVEHWSTPDGGFIVFNYGFDEAIGTTREATEVMFRAFTEQMYRWSE